MSARMPSAKLGALESELAAAKASKAEIEARIWELGIEIRKTEDEDRARADRAAWESIRTLYTYPDGTPFEACATSPRTTSAGPKKWEIGVGINGKLLAVYEVTEYRGRFASVAHKSADVPESVDLAVRMAFELKSPGS